MKKTVVLMICGAMLSANLFALPAAHPAMTAHSMYQQTPKTPEERAEHRTQRLTRELGLTADQQVKVKAVILKREQARGMQAGPAKQDEIAALDAELKTILTPEQFQKLQQKRAENKEKRKPQKQSPAPAK